MIAYCLVEYDSSVSAALFQHSIWSFIWGSETESLLILYETEISWWESPHDRGVLLRFISHDVKLRVSSWFTSCTCHMCQWAELTPVLIAEPGFNILLILTSLTDVLVLAFLDISMSGFRVLVAMGTNPYTISCILSCHGDTWTSTIRDTDVT